MSTPAVSVQGLVKRYGETTAVDGLTLTVERGGVTALLGPNGAGKTTTIEICEGFRRADAGAVRVLDLDPDDQRLRPRVGVMLQSGGVYPGIRADEMLALVASYAAHPLDCSALLARLGLDAVARTPFRRLSGGQQQRLSLAMALVGRPELVFLDEPTAGLDPQARHTTWELIGELRRDGVTVVLTTHYLEEAERLADMVHIVDAGRLVASGPPGELAGRGGERHIRFRTTTALDIASLDAALPPSASVTEDVPGSFVVSGAGDAAVLAGLTAWCAEHGVALDDLRIEQPTLEDVFLQLTGRELRS